MRILRWFAALLVAVSLFGCSRPSPKLDALKADPMASVEIPGVKVQDEYGHPEGEAMGKTHGASYTRIFEITTGTRRHILQAVQELAEAHGWTTDAVDEDYFHATKTLTVNGRHPFGTPADLTLALDDRTSGGLRMTQE